MKTSQVTMKTLMFLALAGFFLHDATAVMHTHQVFYTASSEVPNFPEFVAVGMVDDFQVDYYDSNTKTSVPKQDWMKKATEEDPQYWQVETGKRKGHQQTFKVNLDTLKQRFNQTGDLPTVSLLQKTPSSRLTCHATGFYPNRAAMFWRKDGEELDEQVEHGEILPNHDGSFQMSVDLELPSDDWGKYECVFQLAGVKEDVVTKLDKRDIKTNYGNPLIMTVGIIAAVLLLVTIACAAGFFLKKRNAKRPPSPVSYDRETVRQEMLPK